MKEETQTQELLKQQLEKENRYQFLEQEHERLNSLIKFYEEELQKNLELEIKFKQLENDFNELNKKVETEKSLNQKYHQQEQEKESELDKIKILNES